MSQSSSTYDCNKLIYALCNSKLYSHPVAEIRVIETHISWVILTGPFAYKIKKPLNLGFLDFSSLEKRHHFCNEELRLNQRTAPSIYLQVISIAGSDEKPQWGGNDNIIEYAIQMVQFPQEAQLDRMLQQGELTIAQIDAFAHMIADFHREAATAESDTSFGDPEHIFQPIQENFAQIRERISAPAALQVLDTIEDWTHTLHKKLLPLLMQRKKDGFIRECHGDLHLRNLAWVDDQPIAFDCLEFNPNLRWVDVISDIAFLVMDLQERHQSGMAACFLNTYLEVSGDYVGTRLLQFYIVYRAMVRAKVAAIRLAQQDMDNNEQADIYSEFTEYLSLAESYTVKKSQRLIITHGLSGSGKSTMTGTLLTKINAIRIRSDVERKRLAGMSANERGHADTGKGIYTEQNTTRTYQHLLALTTEILTAGFNVIVDATFLDREQREQFRQLAAAKEVSFTILDFVASADSLRQRIEQRTGDASDANLNILQHQLENFKPLTEAELPYVITIDTETVTDVDIKEFK